MTASRNSKRSSNVKRDLFSQLAIEQWANRVIAAWVTRINLLGITDKGKLIQSFRHRIIWEARGANQEEYLHRVQFLFNYYGKLVDYGLGKGVDMADRFRGGRDPSEMARKREEWIQEPWREELKSLYPIIAAEAGRFAKAMIRNNYEGGVETHFKSRDI